MAYGEASLAEKRLPTAFRDDVELRRYCQRRRQAALLEREPYMADWMQVSDYVEPGRGRFDDPPVNGSPVKKRRTRNKIINNTATRAVRVATAGMSSHMTSKARPWFQLQTPSPELNELYDVRVWLDDVTEIIRDTLAKSNFYKAMPVMYTEDIMFGVAAMLTPQDDDDVIRFMPLTCGTYAIGVDDKGRVDMLWRCWSETARNIVHCYGIKNVPQQVATAYTQNPDLRFTLESMIEKNPDVGPGVGLHGVRPAAKRPYREVIWIMGSEGDKHGVIFVGGHYEAPFVCIRWNPVGEELYSTSPCIDSLGDIKQLQYREGQDLKITDLIAEPPLGIPEFLRNKPASLAPRSKTYLPERQDGTKAGPLYVPDQGASRDLQTSIRTTEDRVKDTLFYPLFLMLDQLGDQTGRTATEIAERKEEKAAVLGPTLEVVTDEGLDPTIIRTYGMCSRAGLIPPPPPALDGIPLKIVYTSILAQAAKAAGTVGIERVVTFVGNLVAMTGDPQYMDKLDVDQVIDEYEDRVGVPARIIRSDEAVAEIRAGRAQDKQRASLAAMAKPAADAANAYKTLATTVPEDGSAAENLGNVLSGAQQ